MSFVVTARQRVEKNVITRVTRVLKGKGMLAVNIGQEVTPDEIIGHSTISSGFRTLNLSSLLSVSPKDVKKYMTRGLGQRIYKDELLASKKEWLLPRKIVITAPTDGVLDYLNDQTGELKISFFPKKIDLPAGVYGIVEQVDQVKGHALIRTEASRIHGIGGTGRSRDGILHILGKRDNLISTGMVRDKYNGGILVGGSLFFKDTISEAISEGVSGIISGGINAEDYKGMAGGRLVFPKKLDNDIGISLVVCEGFGSIPIGDDIFEILADYAGRFVFINGNDAIINLPSFSSSSLTKVRSTALPQSETNGLITNNTKIAELKVGFRVRIIGNSYLGEQGKILKIDDSETLLPSQVKAILATIETASRKIQVPVANLEIMM